MHGVVGNEEAQKIEADRLTAEEEQKENSRAALESEAREEVSEEHMLTFLERETNYGQEPFDVVEHLPSPQLTKRANILGRRGGCHVDEKDQEKLDEKTQEASTGAGGTPANLKVRGHQIYINVQVPQWKQPYTKACGQMKGAMRALQVDRPVLILDEATSALDSALRDVVFQLLKERAQAGCNVILVTHDKELAQRCDTVLNLDAA